MPRQTRRPSRPGSGPARARKGTATYDAVYGAAFDRAAAQMGADHMQTDLAARRLGVTPAARMQWLLDFIRKDLTVLRPEERVALGYDLRALAPGAPGEPTTWRRKAGPMPDALLVALHEEIRQGLRRLTDEDGLPAPEWELPVSGTRERLRRISPRDAKPVRYVVERELSRTDEREIILQGVKHLVLTGGDRLMACPECRWPFLAFRKRKFCTSACLQKHHDRARAPRRRSTKGGR